MYFKSVKLGQEYGFFKLRRAGAAKGKELACKYNNPAH